MSALAVNFNTFGLMPDTSKHSFNADEMAQKILAPFEGKNSALKGLKSKFINACVRIAKDQALTELEREFSSTLKTARQAPSNSTGDKGKR